MKNKLKTWRALACQRVPMIAAILHACSYYENSDKAYWQQLGVGEGTFCVNPYTLEVTYSQQFANTHTPEENAFILAHEGVHVLCDHLNRRQKMKQREGISFQPHIFEIAEEMAVNELVLSIGGWSKVPGGIEPDTSMTNLTTEEKYFELKKKAKHITIKCKCMHGDPKDGDGGRGMGDILKAQAIKAGRKVALENSKGQQPGNMPGELRELASSFAKLYKPPDFRELMLRHMHAMTVSASHFDESTIYRNRMLLDGLCIPNLGNRPQASKFVVSIDNSGSVDDTRFAHLKSILIEAADQLGFNEIIVQHFTTQVMATERYTDLNKLKTFKRRADGGTALEDCDHKAAKTGAVFNIILTDGYVSWLNSYSLPTLIVRTKEEGVSGPPRVRNLIADLVL